MTELEFKKKVKQELAGLVYRAKHPQVTGYDQVYIDSSTVLIAKYATEVKYGKQG